MPDTVNGYNPFEVVSALQKCIRRGMEYDAAFWAKELVHSGAAASGWAWNRLQVIACEDVGPADPNAICVVTSCRDIWDRLHKGAKGEVRESCILMQAVLYLCRAPKSREADALANIMNCDRNGLDPKTRKPDGRVKKMLPIPNAALDGHTIRGASRYKTLAVEQGIAPEEVFTRDFREEGSRVNNPVQTIGQGGVNWVEEVCKNEGTSFLKCMEPTERDCDGS